tara:strand:- start:466 stop:1275 length:810 start_codon:yes stop_codon:yes gene_type:complete
MYNEKNIKDIPVYVICLERKRNERCNSNFPLIKELFPKAKWETAIDGEKIDYLKDDRFSVFSKYNVKNNLRTDITFTDNINQLACALSHIEMWKKVKKSGVPSIIIEDDVYLTKRLKNQIINRCYQIPRNIDFASILYLGNDNTDKYNNDWYRIMNRSFWGLQMYFITPNGASKLLKDIFPINIHIDRYIGYYASVNNNFRAICYKNKYNPSLSELFSNSTLNHQTNIKSVLPESNTFYIILVSTVIIIIIGLIIWLILCKKKCKKKNK